MIEDEDCSICPASRIAPNDNGAAAEARIEAAVLTIARRLPGRQIAREAFERLEAVNDLTAPARTGEEQEDLTG